MAWYPGKHLGEALGRTKPQWWGPPSLPPLGASSASPLVITPYSAPVAQAVREGPLWARASVGRGGAARSATEAAVARDACEHHASGVRAEPGGLGRPGVHVRRPGAEAEGGVME